MMALTTHLASVDGVPLSSTISEPQQSVPLQTGTWGVHMTYHVCSDGPWPAEQADPGNSEELAVMKHDLNTPRTRRLCGTQGGAAQLNTIQDSAGNKLLWRERERERARARARASSVKHPEIISSSWTETQQNSSSFDGSEAKTK